MILVRIRKNNSSIMNKFTKFIQKMYNLPFIVVYGV